jgi:hypothetical protein
MDLFKYLMSEDLITWWEADLCQLVDDIEQSFPTRLADRIRAERIKYAAHVVFEAMEDDLYSDVFTTMSENCWLTSYTLMRRRIHSRKTLLRNALNALTRSIERAEQRWQTNREISVIPTSSGVASGYQDLGRINKGKYRQVNTRLED